MSEPSETNTLPGADAAANPVYALATAPGSAGQPVCYAASRAGLLAAIDGGATWRPLFTVLNLTQWLSAELGGGLVQLHPRVGPGVATTGDPLGQICSAGGVPVVAV